jgi:hypothetical protein
VKKDKAKAPAPRPVPIKPRLVSSRIQPPPPPVLLDTPRPVVDLHGGRDPLKNAGLLPLPMQHGLLMLPHHPSFQMDKRRRPGEERPRSPGESVRQRMTLLSYFFLTSKPT